MAPLERKGGTGLIQELVCRLSNGHGIQFLLKNNSIRKMKLLSCISVFGLLLRRLFKCWAGICDFLSDSRKILLVYNLNERIKLQYHVEVLRAEWCYLRQNSLLITGASAASWWLRLELVNIEQELFGFHGIHINCKIFLLISVLCFHLFIYWHPLLKILKSNPSLDTFNIPTSQKVGDMIE